LILITGATGQLGSAVIAQLLHRTEANEVAALVRDSRKAADLSARGVSVRVADYDNTDGLADRSVGFFADIRDHQLDETSDDPTTLLARRPTDLTAGLRELFSR
jgi:nucleoside-diphosphate-sugar epimerase